MRIGLIAALAANGVIGRDGRVPWRLPADLRYFRRMTWGKPIIMGRKTYESIGRPLPGRTNIVVTRQATYEADGCVVVHSVAEALAAAEEQVAADGEVMVIGGSTLYRALLPRADRLYLTFVEADMPGDTYFPDFDPAMWRELSRETHEPDEANPYRYHFVILERPTAGDGNRGRSRADEVSSGA